MRGAGPSGAEGGRSSASAGGGLKPLLLHVDGIRANLWIRSPGLREDAALIYADSLKQTQPQVVPYIASNGRCMIKYTLRSSHAQRPTP